MIHGPRKHSIELKYLWPQKSEAIFYHHVGLWLDGEYRCNMVLANVRGVKEPWAVITEEDPSLETLWQYGLRFRVEELNYFSILNQQSLNWKSQKFLTRKRN